MCANAGIGTGSGSSPHRASFSRSTTRGPAQCASRSRQRSAPRPSTIPKITWPISESVTVVGVSGNISCWPRGRSTVTISPPQVGPTAKSTAAATVTRGPSRRRPVAAAPTRNTTPSPPPSPA